MALSKRVAVAAHAVGASVEAEQGSIGKMDGYAEAAVDDIICTMRENASLQRPRR